MRNILNFFLGSILFLFSCSTSKNVDNQVLEEAFNIHSESTSIENGLLSKIEDLNQIKNQINIQGRALTEDEILITEKIDKTLASHKFWKDNLPTVPGFEEHHKHDGPCTHKHGNELELLPEDWVNVQREFKDSILAIKNRVEETLNMVENNKIN